MATTLAVPQIPKGKNPPPRKAAPEVGEDDPLFWKKKKTEPPPKAPAKSKAEPKASVKRTTPPPAKSVIVAPPPPPVVVARTPRETVLEAMTARKDDPWSRASTHTILAVPGSAEKDKAYVEPGGSFSPGVKSFGLSFWLTDTLGNFKATSETQLNGTAVTHKLLWPEGTAGVPAIKTECWAYEATWSSQGLGKWLLDLKTLTGSSAKIQLAIRSVGPAGGEIKTLSWDGTALLINNRWRLQFDQPLPLSSVRIGHEGDKDSLRPLTTLTEQKFADGWGQARLDLSSAAQWKITVSETLPPAPLKYVTTKATLETNVPDSQFKESLHAQVAHLMMGLDGYQIWPGDPTSYQRRNPRDAAYVIVALARAGQLDVARELLRDFLEKGTFGTTENDTPGLALWAAEEIAARINQTDCDHQLWPQVAFKADFVANLKPAPTALVTTAFNYRGLLSAASFAERYKKTDEARRWRVRAEELKQAWRQGFIPQLDKDDRVYLAGLWPSGIGTDNKEGLTTGLQRRWSALRDAQGGFRTMPTQTQPDFADAHQWLWLDKPDNAWQTLRWYWNKQAMPGLYTWWDVVPPDTIGKDKSKWEQVRGWVNPSQVSPHYGTAAELLLLQLDMLGYYNEASQELVIGAGAPPSWVDKPMRVSGLHTSIGEISWDWNPVKKEMVVYIPNKQWRDKLKNKVRLGVNFPLKGKKHEVDVKAP